jgi:hypothetical protein
MINLQQFAEERPLSLPAAADYIGKITGTKKPNVSTVWRWCLKGCRGVKLASICIGGKRFVTVSAIERFIADRSLAETSATPPAVNVTPNVAPQVTRFSARRREEIEAARRRLDELTGTNRLAKPTDTPPDATRSA